MASKIIFLLALIIFPAILQAQVSKPSFSVEIKMDKSNYEFGEEIKSEITIKNVSGKKDSLDNYELYDTFGNNVYLYRDLDTVRCLKIMTTIDKVTYYIFNRDDSYIVEYNVSGICSNTKIGNSSYSILDTGLYELQTAIYKKTGFDKINYTYNIINSNIINFRINPPTKSDQLVFFELGNILNYSVEQFRDSIYMLNVEERLDKFIRKNIDTYAADEAYFFAKSLSMHFTPYKEKFLNLSEFYLSSKPNGKNVSIALLSIFINAMKLTGKKESAIEVIKTYEKKYPGTKIEKEAKKIIESE